MGSGHVQVSKEVARRLDMRGVQTRVVDLNQVMVGPTGAWMARLYPWMVNRAPWLYDAVFRVFFKARQDRGQRVGLPAMAAMPGLRRLFATWRPDAVLSTFHIAAQAVGRLREEGSLTAPAMTFVTTFGIHDLWIHPSTDAYLCISPMVADALRRRVPAPVFQCGPVVRPEFDPRRPAPSPSSGGSLPPEVGGDLAGQRVALVVAGSLGMGDVRRVVALLAPAPGWLPVVVCGNNHTLRQQLSQTGDGVVLGWVDDMAGLMARSDVLIDNAGGLTSKEALGMGLPVVVFRPIAGHGRDDAAAMAALGVSEVVNDDRSLLAALERATAGGAAERAQRGRALFKGDAADAIQHWLGSRSHVSWRR
jgi:UDP-N-acetylglucosamine:LPS N-acetylglucosamine transferase